MSNSIFEENFLEVPAPDVLGRGSLLQVEHRASCHRCGNMRKNVIKCTECPHVFCRKCGDKMVAMDGLKVFVNGCPLCKDLCCCGTHRSSECTRQFHCYKKCLKSRMSPRNASPRSTASYNLFGPVQAPPVQQRAIEEFMPDSDSEDDIAFQGQAAQTAQSGAGLVGASNLVCVSTDTTEGTSFHRGLPVHLPPIDTSLGFHQDTPRSSDRPKSKTFRSADNAETPQKKVRTAKAVPRVASDAELLADMQAPSRVQSQVYTVPQPPFNTGIPSIFAPHSLTPETNPFFLQSSLPCTTRLPPLRSLLGQSRKANPFLEALPPYLQSELGNVRGFDHLREPYLHNPFGLGLRQGCPHWAPPDPAVGYGFTFGGNVALSSPPWLNTPTLPLATTSQHAGPLLAGNGANGGTGGELSAHDALRMAHFPMEVEGGASAGVGVGQNQSVLQSMRPDAPFITTPNIDRACHFLQHSRGNIKFDRPGTLPHRTDSSSTSLTATSSSPEHHHQDQHVRDRGNQERGKDQDNQAEPEPSNSQSSDLFATPRVTVPEPTALSQASQARGQGQGQGAHGTQGEYQWTGSSINSLQYLGVDVLTPAGLPQCTPLVEASALPSHTPHAQAQGHHYNHSHLNHSTSFYQSVDHENMLFLHSMLTDPFTDLAQDDLFLGDASVMSGTSGTGGSAGGGTGGVGVSGGGEGGDGSQDHDEVIAKWLASARFPQPAVPSAASAASATHSAAATACR